MLEVIPLTDSIGAEIRGVDLREPLDAATCKAFNDVLLDHLVLVLRGQELTAEQFRDALSAFGEIMEQHRAKFILPQCREVSRVVNGEGLRPAAEWHTDHTNHEIPPKITSLYGVTIPDGEGDTAFANMYVAYDRLSDADRAQAHSLTTLNSMEDSISYTDADRARYPGGIPHPLVRVHPETCKRSLYFHISKSQKIEGMADAAVRPYLQSLLDKGISAEGVYRHAWRKGDVVICDNRCTMHRVHADYSPQTPRLLWRTLVRGDRPAGPTDATGAMQ